MEIEFRDTNIRIYPQLDNLSREQILGALSILNFDFREYAIKDNIINRYCLACKHGISHEDENGFVEMVVCSKTGWKNNARRTCKMWELVEQ